jgi:hypothetical protein
LTAYSNAQLNTIYSYLGYNFYLEFDPHIKNMILATQSTVDGGSQPDNSLQLQVLSICTNLATVDQNLLNLQSLDFISTSSSGAKLDVARGDFLLRKQGRALIKQLCIIFALKGVRQDYYSRSPLHNEMADGGNSRFPYDS